MKQPTYLERLTFDPKLATGFIAKYLKNIRFVILLTVTMVLVGIASYQQLPQRLNPEIKIPIVIISSVLPGASPADIEQLITKPIEDEVRSVKGIDTVSSVSRENVSIISMQFLSSVNGEEAKADVKDIVDSINDLPEDAQTPVVTLIDFEDQPIWSFVVTSQTDLPSLMSFSKNLKKMIEDLPNVDRVATTGYEDQEVVVEVDPEKIIEYHINPFTISTTLQKAVVSYPAGVLHSAQNTYSFTIDPTVITIDDIRNLRLEVDGQILLLSDIAHIYEKSLPDLNQAFIVTSTTEPQRVVTFYIYKTSGSDIVKTGEKVKEKVMAYQESFHGQYQIQTITDVSEMIQTQFEDLLKEFRSTILLVMGCLFLFLGFRQALLSSLTVPLTFLSAFICMRIFGMSINFLSLFSFLLSLGLLVDDTIVVVAAMTRYYRSGKFTPQETGILVWKDTIVPIWSTTITTIWSFVPLLLATGIIGEFIKPIPIVVTVTMISSTAIAVLITLPIMIILLKPNIPQRVIMLTKIAALFATIGLWIWLLPNNIWLLLVIILYISLLGIGCLIKTPLSQFVKQHTAKYTSKIQISPKHRKYINSGVIDLTGFEDAYQRFILNVLNSRSARHKVILAIVIYSIFSFALLPMGFVKNEFFPKSNEDEFYVNLELPSGTNLDTVKKINTDILAQLRNTPESTFVIAETGNYFNDMGGLSQSENAILYTVHLKPAEERSQTSQAIAEQVRKQLVTFDKGKVSIIEVSGGPPAGSDLQIKLLGDDLAVLDQQADKIITYLTAQPGVTTSDKSIKPGTSRLVFVPDLDNIQAAGLSIDSVGFWMRLYTSGFTLEKINFDKTSQTKQAVNFRMGYNSTQDLESISQIQIPTQQGTPVPLISLGQIVPETNPTMITRENGKRTISVSAGVRAGQNIPSINAELEKFADTLSLPQGYTWQTGGLNEENQKSVTSILEAMVLAFILILVTMVIQFNSFRQAIIVILVIPLAVSSVFLAFALTGTPLSFPAIIGILSLFGIVVTNSMFIVDKINLNLKEKMPFKNAISNAGASRMEPIILTKLSTVFGLLPITLSDPLWRGLGGAIISGLLIASSIMLLFIPVVYYSWMKPAAEDHKSAA